jgi:hypothetical protein
VAIGPHATRQLRLAIQALHGRRRHGVLAEPSVRDQRAQDRRHRRGRVLAPDVEQELALLGRQLARAAAIRARRWAERVETTAAVRVEPALDGGEAELLGDPAAGRAIFAGGDRAERGGELAARQLALDHGADDRRAEQGDSLAVIARHQGLSGHEDSVAADGEVGRRGVLVGPTTVWRASPIQRGGRIVVDERTTMDITASPRLRRTRAPRARAS